MIDENFLSEIKQVYLDSLKKKSEVTKDRYLYWFSRFPHTQFLEVYKTDPAKAQRIIFNFIRRWDNSVCRGFMKSYLKCFELFGRYVLPEKEKERKKRTIKKTLTLEEVNLLGRQIKKDYPYRFSFAFQLMYHGALRVSELTTIKLNSFDWNKWFKDPDEDMYLLIKGKGNKERIVLIPAKVMMGLMRYLTEIKIPKFQDYQIKQLPTNEDPLFDPNSFNQNIFYQKITKASLKILKKRINPHLIRHSKATHLLDMGVEIKDIQNYLGHSNLATTEVYLHRSQRQSLENIKQLEKKNGS